MKPWLIMLAVISLAACSPADQKVESVKERLDAGEVVEFSKPGYRRPSCREGAPDWRDYRVANDDERMRIVVRKQASGLNAGPHSCFRVGGEVIINSKGAKATADLGLARITKLSLVKIDALQKSHLKGKYFANNEEFFKYKDDMKFRMKPDHQGIVTILDFDYVASSAVDEKELVQKDIDQSSGDAYEETKNDGDTLSKCNTPWVDVRVPEAEYSQAILSGKLNSYYSWGSRNCLAQGQEVAIVAGKDAPVLGKVKIAKIKRFRASYVDPKYFAASEFDLVKLQNKIRLENREEFITVMDFVVEGATKSVDGPITALLMSPSSDSRFSAWISGKTNFREGDLVELRVLGSDKSEVVSVRIESQEYFEPMGYTRVTVSRIAGVAK